MHITLFANLFFAGILAGLEIAAHYGFHGPTLALDTKPQILLRQGLVRTLRWLVPAFFVPATITAVVLVLQNDSTVALTFRLAALTAYAVWIYARVVGTVKINSASLKWNTDNPPKDWKGQIAKAERFHLLGTWVTVIAFVCMLVAADLQQAF
jgi:hypothetical protein